MHSRRLTPAPWHAHAHSTCWRAPQACKTINSLVTRAHITGIVGYADGGGSINVQGEEQKTLDVLTNDVLKRALRFTGKMGVIASEDTT